MIQHRLQNSLDTGISLLDCSFQVALSTGNRKYHLIWLSEKIINNIANYRFLNLKKSIFPPVDADAKIKNSVPENNKKSDSDVKDKSKNGKNDEESSDESDSDEEVAEGDEKQKKKKKEKEKIGFRDRKVNW